MDRDCCSAADDGVAVRRSTASVPLALRVVTILVCDVVRVRNSARLVAVRDAVPVGVC